MQDVGIFVNYGMEIDLSLNLRLIKEAGFDSVMTFWPDRILENADVIGLVHEYGLYIDCAHLPYRDINGLWRGGINGDAIEEWIVKWTCECSFHSIPVIVLHVNYHKDDNGIPAFNKIGLERFKKIVDNAEKHNIKIALENGGHNEHLEYIMQNIQSPNLGVCYDSGHNHCFTPKIDILAKYKKNIFALHLSDNDGIGDQHLLPFDGTIDWHEVARQLCKTNFNGSLVLEVQQNKFSGYGGLCAEEFLRLSYNQVNKLKNLIKNTCYQ